MQESILWFSRKKPHFETSSVVFEQGVVLENWRELTINEYSYNKMVSLTFSDSLYWDKQETLHEHVTFWYNSGHKHHEVWVCARNVAIVAYKGQ